MSNSPLKPGELWPLGRFQLESILCSAAGAAVEPNADAVPPSPVFHSRSPVPKSAESQGTGQLTNEDRHS